MKEFGIPFQLWMKIPVKGDEKRIGYQDLLGALRWKYKLEEDEYKRAKGKTQKKGIDLEFE